MCVCIFSMFAVPPSMPIFGAGSGTSGGVPVSIPPFPVQPVQNRASTSSSGSDSESSSDSSSGSSSDSSDTEDGKVCVLESIILCK